MDTTTVSLQLHYKYEISIGILAEVKLIVLFLLQTTTSLMDNIQQLRSAENMWLKLKQKERSEKKNIFLFKCEISLFLLEVIIVQAKPGLCNFLLLKV